MNNSFALMLALAACGLILALPAQAAKDRRPAAQPVAQADKKASDAGKENQRAARRRDEGERGYGYGFERRQRSERPADVGGRDRPASRDTRTERSDRPDRRERGFDRPSRRNRH